MGESQEMGENDFMDDVFGELGCEGGEEGEDDIENMMQPQQA